MSKRFLFWISILSVVVVLFLVFLILTSDNKKEIQQIVKKSDKNSTRDETLRFIEEQKNLHKKYNEIINFQQSAIDTLIKANKQLSDKLKAIKVFATQTQPQTQLPFSTKETSCFKSDILEKEFLAIKSKISELTKKISQIEKNISEIKNEVKNFQDAWSKTSVPREQRERKKKIANAFWCDNCWKE